MKKSLLFLGLLGLASSVQAQQYGPWAQVNLINSSAFAPGYLVRDIKTVSANAAWAVIEENSSTGNPTAFFVTNNAAGDQFDFGAINDPNASQNYQAGNISSVGNSSLVAVAATYPLTGAGGEILRTTNGGVSWTKVSTTANFQTSQQGFCNFVHMFDNLEGVTLGDPTSGYFEILRTTNGGVTWTRIPQANIPAPLANEYGLARSFFALGNTIWCGMGSSVTTDPVRVLKSTDKGVTWTASSITTLLGGISRLAFKDALNGIAYNTRATNGVLSQVNVIRTSDGGATWSPITPLNTATGSFFWYDIDAANGKYYSVGARFPETTPAVPENRGSSFSNDGINWTNISTAQPFLSIDVIPGTAPGSAVGYAGAATDANGVGGMYKTSTAILATRDAALQSGLSVYPNPSATGVFRVDLGSTLKAGAQLTVVDIVGRQVLSQTLTATAVGSKTLNLDLSGEKTGVYTLQIRTEAGIATQKIVID